jgi:hypothetical protein
LTGTLWPARTRIAFAQRSSHPEIVRLSIEGLARDRAKSIGYSEQNSGVSLAGWRVPLNEVWLVPRGIPAPPITPFLSWIVRETLRAYWTYTEAASHAWWDITRWDFSSIMDWAEDEEIDIGRYTYAEAKAASDVWHEQFFSEVDFGQPIAPGLVVATFTDGHTVHRLVTPQQLTAEGLSMDHCVGGYWQKVRDDSHHIFSLRDPDQVPLVTWALLETRETDSGALRHVKIEQIMDPHDAHVPLDSLRFQHVSNFLGKIGADIDSWSIRDVKVLGDWLRPLTVDRAAHDQPELNLEGPRTNDHDVFKAWWALEEAAGLLEWAIKDQTKAWGGDLTEEDWREWLSDHEEIYTDDGFEDWEQDRKEETQLWTQDAWGNWRTTLANDLAEVSYLMNARLTLFDNYMDRDGLSWCLEIDDDEDQDFQVKVSVDEYDGDVVYRILDGTQEIARSSRTVMDAAIKAGLVRFQSELDAELAAARAAASKPMQLVLPEALDVGVVPAIQAAQAAGQVLRKDTQRVLRRAGTGDL